MAILNNPQKRTEIIQGLACGKSQASISKQVGISQQHVSRIASRDDIQACVEQERLRLVEVIPDAVQNVKDLVTGMKHIPKNEIKRLELAYKATKDVLCSVGLLKSPYININNDNRQQTVIRPEVFAIIGKYLEDEENKEYENV